MIEITADDYLRLMAELRRTMVVEHDETLSFPIFTGGAREPDAATGRLQIQPRTISGFLALARSRAAVFYLLDSVGQETTIFYDGLHSFGDIQQYWQQRGELWRSFVTCYRPQNEDLHDLARQLDCTLALAAFDLDAFAARRGLTAGVERSVR